MTREIDALAALELEDWAPVPDDVWQLSRYHVDGLHAEVMRRLTKSLDVVARSGTPIATVIQGPRGAGKTHLINWTRKQIQSRNGYFFLMKLVSGFSFWDSAVNSIVDGFFHAGEDGRFQVVRLLETLAERAGVSPEVRAALTGKETLEPDHVEAFVAGLRRLSPQVGIQAADTARALALYGSSGDEAEVGYAYLSLVDGDPRKRAAWGIGGSRTGQLMVRDLTRLIALGGPIVFAFDQLDSLVNLSSVARGDTRRSGENTEAERLRDDIAAGLMELREESRRSLIVVACHVDTWEKISASALLSARERFDVLPRIDAVPDAAIGERIITARFDRQYAAANFKPRYSTWPVQQSFFREAAHRLTVRNLLMRVHKHITACIATGLVTELTGLTPQASPQPTSSPPEAATEDFSELDTLYDNLRQEADDRTPLVWTAEDGLMPPLLGAGLHSLVLESGVDAGRFAVETDFGKAASLHARLRLTLGESSEEEAQWCYRALSAGNPNAVQARLHKALVEAGVVAGLQTRRLTILRNSIFPKGEKTERMKVDFESRGGRSIPIGAADLRTLSALRELLSRQPKNLEAWLRARRPASRTEVFAPMVADLRELLPEASSTEEEAAEQDPAGLSTAAATTDLDVVVGLAQRSRRPFTVDLEKLRKHALVVGGSGSGKTVLLRHLIEQCALRGVSAVVLDPNNDLASLGDPWSSPPDGWSEDQQRESERYFAGTEFLVWTPGMSNGRPMSFHPLPDFSGILDDADDYRRALDATVATLAPQARVTGRSQRTTQQLSILRRALDHYVRSGGRTLAGFIDTLAELPDGVANFRSAARLAAEMADTLEAATDNDPLFGESGEPVDPGALFRPAAGRPARISVISLIGLPEEAQKQSFVSRLQMAIFGWFKSHPARDRPLAGLLVMDEAQLFVPATGETASSATTKTLISQVRKYGLGLVLATQAPKNLHHTVAGNSAHQFIGRLTVPAQISAAEQMAQARGGALDSLARLEPGVFYAAGEGTSFSRIQVPYCLSSHAGPLHEEEVLQKARQVS